MQLQSWIVVRNVGILKTLWEAATLLGMTASREKKMLY
jgi:hypothetical protein